MKSSSVSYNFVVLSLHRKRKVKHWDKTKQAQRLPEKSTVNNLNPLRPDITNLPEHVFPV